MTDTFSLKRADPNAWTVDATWQSLLNAFWQTEHGLSLQAFLTERISSGVPIFPPQPLRALLLTPLQQVRVVILGQDPYHGAGQAEGLAFSVQQGIDIPPSLRNIFKELRADVGLQPPMSGSLVPWAKRGVLLLNTCLTVEESKAASHVGQGWEALTDDIIRTVAMQPQPIVFLLWGAYAQAKRQLIESAQSGQRLLLTANHPSPLSALRQPIPFIGCRHFSIAQAWLLKQDISFSWDLE